MKISKYQCWVVFNFFKSVKSNFHKDLKNLSIFKKKFRHIFGDWDKVSNFLFLYSIDFQSAIFFIDLITLNYRRWFSKIDYDIIKKLNSQNHCQNKLLKKFTSCQNVF
jgi:hypothetical protein